MTAFIGYTALFAAMMTAGVQAVFLGRQRETAATFLGLVTFSFGALIYAHMTDDFTILNVVQNSHSMKPMIYKFAGTWGNHEGSMMLWLWWLSAWGFLLSWFSRGAGGGVETLFWGRALSVQGLLSFGFAAFVLLTSNPFVTLTPAPAEGMDLNPMLQDPALALHPPMLYAGYVGFSAVYSLAIAALTTRKSGINFPVLIRRWVMAAWSFLTVGIALGAFWAYYELGWGGFWFWDPVENASLMPWLAATALLHILPLAERYQGYQNWMFFLAILSFCLSMLGTFLVRSGVLTSVHAFASDPLRGVFILGLLGLTAGGGFFVFAKQAVLTGADDDEAPAKPLRAVFLLFNNIFIMTALVTVTLGTLYPIIANAFDWGAVSVGAPYFKKVLTPLLLPFLALAGFAVLTSWRGGVAAEQARRAALPLALSLPALLVPGGMLFKGVMGMCLYGVLQAVMDAALKGRKGWTRSYVAMTLGHVGFILMVFGSFASTNLGEEKMLWLKSGEHIVFAGRDMAFLGVEEGRGKNYAYQRAVMTVGGVYLTPERRWYPVTQKLTSETSLSLHGPDILYAVLGEQDEKRGHVVRLYYHPFLTMIFLGAALMGFAGAVTVLRRKA